MTQSLPVEIWTRILSIAEREDDLVEKWLSYRSVNHLFRGIIESIFCTQHLRKTWIVFSLDMEFVPPTERHLSLTFEFSHVSEDRTLAIFRPLDLDEDQRKETIARLKKPSWNPIQQPLTYVNIRREVNDTPIPNLQISFLSSTTATSSNSSTSLTDEITLSCDWRGLYTRFYGEQKLYQARQEDWAFHSDASKAELSSRVARGEITFMNAIEIGLKSIQENMFNARKRVRRARMMRQYAELGREEEVVDEELEEQSLRVLEDMRMIDDWQKDSDFNTESEGGEEASGDEEESEEWETDDDEEDGNDDETAEA